MDDESRDDFLRSTWRVSPRLEVSWLSPPALLFALVDRDPIPAYRDRAARIPPRDTADLPWHLVALWDMAFRDVDGDKVYQLLDDHRAVQGLDAGGKPATVYHRTAFTLSSNTAPGPRWLMTRGVAHEGKARAWCLCVETRLGATEPLVLTDDNALDLGEIAGGSDAVRG